MKNLYKKCLENFVSKPIKLLLKMAEENKGIFNFKKTEKTQKNRNRSVYNNEELLNEFDDIWKILIMNPSKLKLLENLKNICKIGRKTLINKTNEFIQIRNSLSEEIIKFNKVVYEQILTKFSSIDVFKFLLWFQKVLLY